MNGEDMGHEVEYRTDDRGRLEAIAGTCVCVCVCVCDDRGPLEATAGNASITTELVRER